MGNPRSIILNDPPPPRAFTITAFLGVRRFGFCRGQSSSDHVIKDSHMSNRLICFGNSRSSCQSSSQFVYNDKMGFAVSKKILYHWTTIID